MKISEVAREAGVGVETIRYYERRGLIPNPPRSASGYRQYEPDAVRRIAFVKRAQGLGFTLVEIEELLGLRVTPGTCTAVEEQATRTIARVDERLRDLRRMRAALSDLVEACRSRTNSGECPILSALDAGER